MHRPVDAPNLSVVFEESVIISRQLIATKSLLVLVAVAVAVLIISLLAGTTCGRLLFTTTLAGLFHAAV